MPHFTTKRLTASNLTKTLRLKRRINLKNTKKNLIKKLRSLKRKQSRVTPIKKSKSPIKIDDDLKKYSPRTQELMQSVRKKLAQIKTPTRIYSPLKRSLPILEREPITLWSYVFGNSDRTSQRVRRQIAPMGEQG